MFFQLASLELCTSISSHPHCACNMARLTLLGPADAPSNEVKLPTLPSRPRTLSEPLTLAACLQCHAHLHQGISHLVTLVITSPRQHPHPDSIPPLRRCWAEPWGGRPTAEGGSDGPASPGGPLGGKGGKAPGLEISTALFTRRCSRGCSKRQTETDHALVGRSIM